MRVIDADGHVEENPITFSDKYFAPEFRPHHLGPVRAKAEPTRRKASHSHLGTMSDHWRLLTDH